MRRVGKAPFVGNRSDRLTAQERVGQVIRTALEPCALDIAADAVVLFFKQTVQVPHRDIQAVGQADRAQAWLAQRLINDFLHIAAQVIAVQRSNALAALVALLQRRTQQRDEGRLQRLHLRGVIVGIVLAQLVHQHMQHAPTGLGRGDLAEGPCLTAQVLAYRVARQGQRGVFDQAEGGDFDGAHRVHQQHLARRQLHGLLILGDLRIAAALADQKTFLVVVMVGVVRRALDQPGIGAQDGQATRQVMDLADKQRTVESQFGIEVAARVAQFAVPAVEPVRCMLWDAHGVSPQWRYSCCSGAIVNMLSICAQQQPVCPLQKH